MLYAFIWFIEMACQCHKLFCFASNSHCFIVTTVVYVLAHTTGTALYSSYIPGDPQPKMLCVPMKRTKQPTIELNPRDCRLLD